MGFDGVHAFLNFGRTLDRGDMKQRIPLINDRVVGAPDDQTFLSDHDLFVTLSERIGYRRDHIPRMDKLASQLECAQDPPAGARNQWLLDDLNDATRGVRTVRSDVMPRFAHDAQNTRHPGTDRHFIKTEPLTRFIKQNRHPDFARCLS